MASPTTSSSSTSGQAAEHRRRRRRAPRRGRAGAGAAGRPATTARREAAITWSGEAGRPRRRRAWAASTKNRETPSAPGWRKTWSYQPGADDAGAVAGGATAAAGASTAPRSRRPSPSGGRGAAAASRGRRGGRRVEGGDVPRPADDGRNGPAGEGRSDGPAHVGLARRRRARGSPCRPGPRPSPRRRRRTPARRRRGARRGPPTSARGRAHRLPPPARRADRVAAGRPPAATEPESSKARTTASGRSMASTGTPCSTAHAHRLPLRAELGERGEHGPLRAGRRRSRAGRRGDQPGVADPAEGRAGVGGRLDEHDVGTELVERAAHRACRAGAVVADAQQVQPPRRRPTAQPRSRQAS